VILHEVMGGDRGPWQAWFMLCLGIGATTAANVLSGLPHGPAAAVWNAWPAVAFVGTVEIVMLMIRKAAPAAAESAEWQAVPSTAQSAAEASLRATLAAGNPLSGRQLETQFGLSRAVATKVRQSVLAETNGHAVL
jgi:hypothetical protein